MQFIDTHIHLQDFNKDFALEILDSNSVKAMLLISAKKEDWKNIVKLVGANPNKLLGALGVHPWYCDDVDENLLKFDRKSLVGGYDRVVKNEGYGDKIIELKSNNFGEYESNTKTFIKKRTHHCL